MKLLPILQSIYILGDIGYFGRPLTRLIDIFRINVSLNDNRVILLGDNFYPEGIKEKDDNQWKLYESAFRDVPYKRINAVMGNHDYMGDPKLQLSSKYFENNEFYYKRSFLNFDLFFLDTVILYSGHCYISKDIIENVHGESASILKKRQLKWLTDELEKSTNNGRRKIVFGHYPIISNGFYFDQVKPLYKTLIPIFEKFRIDAYISGHEHNIQYIKREISKDYVFHQFIMGSSSENRQNEVYNPFHNDFFDNTDTYFLELYEKDNQLFFNFKNKYNTVKHLFII